jgi:dihydrofolate synthase/folylpolyglutamate synthase
VQKRPYLILDGAHNVASIKAVISSIKERFNCNRLISIFGMSKDKDIKGVSAELDSVSDIVILTQSREKRRAEDSTHLKEYFFKAGLYITEDVSEAVKKGLGLADAEDLILVTGSLFVVGEALAWTRKNYKEVYA